MDQAVIQRALKSRRGFADLRVILPGGDGQGASQQTKNLKRRRDRRIVKFGKLQEIVAFPGVRNNVQTVIDACRDALKLAVVVTRKTLIAGSRARAR